MSADTGRKKGSNKAVPSNGWEPAPLPRTGGAPEHTGTNIERLVSIVNAWWKTTWRPAPAHAKESPRVHYQRQLLSRTGLLGTHQDRASAALGRRSAMTSIA